MLDSINRRQVVGALGGFGIAVLTDSASAHAKERGGKDSYSYSSYRVKLVNESSEDLQVRFMSIIGASDLFPVGKNSSTIIPAEQGPSPGEKVWAAFEDFAETVFAFEKVTITGPTIITIAANKKITSAPLNG